MKIYKAGPQIKSMKRILFAALLSVIILSVSANSLPIDLSVKPSSADVFVDSYRKYDITIKNNQNFKDGIVLIVDGQYFEWSSLRNYYVEIEPNSTFETGINIYPQKEGKFVYYITAMSLKTELKDSATIYVKSLLPGKVYLKGFSAELFGDSLRMVVNLSSREVEQAYVSFAIKDKDWQNVFEGSFSQSIQGEQQLVNEFKLPDLLAGDYLITVVVNKNLTAEDKFTIEPVKTMVETEKFVSNPFLKEYQITVENKGNVIDTYTVKRTAARTEWVSYSVQPSRKYPSEDKMIYEWDLKSMNPKQTATVVFRIEYWPVYIIGIVVASAIVIIVGFVISRASRPKIVKVVKKKDGEFLVINEVKGPLFYPVTDVLIRDTVPPMAKVLRKFHGMEPVVRETEEGTELVWKIDDLKPKDERIFTYMIKPVIGAHLKMPKSYVRFRTKSNKKFRVYSDHVFVEMHH